MKKLLIIILICFSAHAFSQKVFVDRLEKDGCRQIMTKTKKIKIGNDKYRIGLKVFKETTHEDWYLLVSSDNCIPDDAQLLIRFIDDEVIHLYVNNVNIGDITHPAYTMRTSSYSAVTYPSYTSKYYSSLFVLDNELMDKLSEKGIKKIRITSCTSYNESDFSYMSIILEDYSGYSKIGNYIKKARKNIQNRLDEVENINEEF